MDIDIMLEPTPEERMYAIMLELYKCDTFERKNPDIMPINFEVLEMIIDFGGVQ